VLDLIFEIRERLRLERIHVKPCSFFHDNWINLVTYNK